MSSTRSRHVRCTELPTTCRRDPEPRRALGAQHPADAAVRAERATPDRGDWVELRGFEPLTFCMPCRRATNCAIAPANSPRADSTAQGANRGRSKRPNPRRRRSAVVAEHRLRQAAGVVLGQPPAACALLEHRPAAVGQAAEDAPLLDGQVEQPADGAADRAPVRSPPRAPPKGPRPPPATAAPARPVGHLATGLRAPGRHVGAGAPRRGSRGSAASGRGRTGPPSVPPCVSRRPASVATVEPETAASASAVSTARAEVGGDDRAPAPAEPAARPPRLACSRPTSSSGDVGVALEPVGAVPLGPTVPQQHDRGRAVSDARAPPRRLVERRSVGQSCHSRSRL